MMTTTNLACGFKYINLEKNLESWLIGLSVVTAISVVNNDLQSVKKTKWDVSIKYYITIATGARQIIT